MFYEFHQNNSGGSFTCNENLAYIVVIEALTPEEANSRAESVGVYFDDEYDIDCDCCGQRWSRAYDGKEVPSSYGSPLVLDAVERNDRSWSQAIIHYTDGTKLRVACR